MLRILGDLIFLSLNITRFFFLGNKVTSIKCLEIMLYNLIIKLSDFVRKSTALQDHIKSKRTDIRFNGVKKKKKNHTIITISQYKMALNSPFHLWLYLNSKPEGKIRSKMWERSRCHDWLCVKWNVLPAYLIEREWKITAKPSIQK